jgi:hypothetical protein
MSKPVAVQKTSAKQTAVEEVKDDQDSINIGALEIIFCDAHTEIRDFGINSATQVMIFKKFFLMSKRLQPHILEEKKNI